MTDRLVHCSGCKLDLPPEMFWVAPSQHDGYSSLCKRCQPRSEFARRYASREGEMILAAIRDCNNLRFDGLRRCVRCLVEKPADNFTRQIHACDECVMTPAGWARTTRMRQQRELERNGERLCKTCGLILPLTSFYARTGGRGWQTECKDCQSARDRRRVKSARHQS